MNITAKPEGINLQLQCLREMKTNNYQCTSSRTSLKKDSGLAPELPATLSKSSHQPHHYWTPLLLEHFLQHVLSAATPGKNYKLFWPAVVWRDE